MLHPRTHTIASLWLAGCCSLLPFAGCSGSDNATPANTLQPAPPPPPGAPAAPPDVPQGRDVPGAQPAATPTAVPAATPTAVPAARPAAAPGATKPTGSTKSHESTAHAPASPVKPASNEPRVPEPPAPSAPAAPPPAPAAPPPPPAAPAPVPAAKTKVTVPHTDHVSVDVPAGMQALLDDDDRMQPWVNKVIPVADRCYASKGGGADAAIVVDVTMHENARPDADIRSLPPALAGVVACATGDLMRTKMPLFTGPEGQRHTLKIRFKP